MADTTVKALALAGDFQPATEADWRALVDKTLGEAPFSSLEKVTVEGLPIAPLYAPAPKPGAPARAVPADRAWEVATLTAHPDPARANAEILADLRGGAAAAVLRIDPAGKTGVALGSAADLARALDGVILEFAPVALDAGFLGPQAADWLGAAAKASPSALVRFHLDPVSAFAEAGASPGPIEAHLISAATVAARLAETYPQAQLMLASGRVVHEAGGGEAAEVAFAAASAIAYARALVRAGLVQDRGRLRRRPDRPRRGPLVPPHADRQGRLDQHGPPHRRGLRRVGRGRRQRHPRQFHRRAWPPHRVWPPPEPQRPARPDGGSPYRPRRRPRRWLRLRRGPHGPDRARRLGRVPGHRGPGRRHRGPSRRPDRRRRGRRQGRPARRPEDHRRHRVPPGEGDPGGGGDRRRQGRDGRALRQPPWPSRSASPTVRRTPRTSTRSQAILASPRSCAAPTRPCT